MLIQQLDASKNVQSKLPQMGQLFHTSKGEVQLRQKSDFGTNQIPLQEVPA
jgi:hypothetical protein